MFILSIVFWFKSDLIFYKKYGVILVSIFLGSVLPDLQGFYSIYFDDSVPLHGFSHTILGSVFYSIVFSFLFMSFIRALTRLSLDLPKYIENTQSSGILFQSLIGIFFGINIFHLIPDMILYSDIQIFAPFSDFVFANPYYSPLYGYLIYNPQLVLFVTRLFISMAIIGEILIFLRFFKLFQSRFYNNKRDVLFGTILTIFIPGFVFLYTDDQAIAVLFFILIPLGSILIVGILLHFYTILIAPSRIREYITNSIDNNKYLHNTSSSN